METVKSSIVELLTTAGKELAEARVEYVNRGEGHPDDYEVKVKEYIRAQEAFNEAVGCVDHLLSNGAKSMTQHDEANKITSGKVRFDLVDPTFEYGLAAAVTNGTANYIPHSWKQVDWSLYYGAHRRHLNEHAIGKHIDPKTGLLHLDHAAACLMFMRWLALQDEKLCKDYFVNLENRTYMEGK